MYMYVYMLHTCMSLPENKCICELEHPHLQQRGESRKRVWYEHHLTITMANMVATDHADSAAAVQNHHHCRLSSRISCRSPTSAHPPQPICCILKTEHHQHRIILYQSRKRERSGCSFVDFAESGRSDPELYRGE
jgi:hypothetical protein